MTSSPEAAQPAESKTSELYFWYLLIVLLAASTISYIDRQIPALMIGPIKRDLGISDTEVGLLIGLAFSIVYALMLLPMAWLADTRSRRAIIGIGLFSWSLMTALSGFAENFGQLFAARMGVGIGEATLAPAAYSLLADAVRRDRLPLALGIFASASFIGIGLANVLGGWLVAFLESMPPVDLPIIGETRSWQLTFFILGGPGILLSFLMLTIREPGRSGVAEPQAGTGSIRLLLKFFRENSLLLAMHFGGLLFISIQAWTFFGWIVEFFIREHHMARADAGMAFGIIAFAAGLAGSIVAGRIAMSLLKNNVADATLRVIAWGALAMWPLSIAMALVPDVTIALALLVPITFFMAWPPGLGVAALQTVSPNQIRGRVVAVYLILTSFLSIGFGPLLVGVINDYVFQSEAALGKTLALMAAITYPCAAICLFLSLKPLRRALAVAQSWK